MIAALRRCPVGLLLGAALTRAAPAVWSVLAHGDTRLSLTPDSLEYLQLASSLAWSGAFARNGSAEIFRTPLYPAFLVPGTWLGAPVAAAIVLQVGLSVLVTALVFDTAARLTHSRRAATGAAVIYLLEPGQPIWSSVVLADALLTAVTALLMWVAVRYPLADERAWRGISLLALAGAAGAYVKPPAYFLAAFVAIGLAAAWWRRAPGRVVTSRVAALLILNAVALSAWHVRNYAAAGYAGFSTQFELAAFMAAPAAIEGVRSGRGFAEVRERIGPVQGGAADAEAARRFRQSGPPSLIGSLPEYAYLHVRGSTLALMDPGLYWWNHVLGRESAPAMIGSTFVNAGARAGLDRLRTVTPGAIVPRVFLSLWPACCLALWAVAAWRRRHWPNVHVLGLIVILWLLIAGGPHADIRLRSPIVPLLSVLAAAGLPRRLVEASAPPAGCS